MVGCVPYPSNLVLPAVYFTFVTQDTVDLKLVFPLTTSRMHKYSSSGVEFESAMEVGQVNVHVLTDSCVVVGETSSCVLTSRTLVLMVEMSMSTSALEPETILVTLSVPLQMSS